MKKGFKAVQKNIAKKEGIPMKNAGAILASATRKASPQAKAKNPALKNVLMPKEGSKKEQKGDKGKENKIEAKEYGKPTDQYGKPITKLKPKRK